jgi:hypothetical protein
MSSISGPYFATLLELRCEFIDGDGDPAEFEELFSAANSLTSSQTSLCRKIFQQAYVLWDAGITIEKMSSVVAILADSIPEFSEYEKEETTHMILKMVSVLPRRNTSNLVETEHE